MPASPASSHLPEGQRGGGATSVTSVPSSASSVVPSASVAVDRDRATLRGSGGDDLTSRTYSISTPDSVLSTPSWDGGRSSSSPFGAGGADSSGGLIRVQEGVGGPSRGSPVMDVTRLQQQLSEFTDSLFAEGLLDDQFTQLQLLQDANNPDFVAEVVSLFFEDSEKLLEQLTESLETTPIDYRKVDAHVHQFKGSSSSIGAQRVKTACITFRTCCEEENREGCQQALVQVKNEFNLVKTKLELLLKMEQQILAAGGTLPFME
ncbi:histidine-containing phosphotransfer peotein [Marchantia polymorpha subsp. ruderalis]|uniref:Histidine-containing phosphotransfer protein n=2 Tax=Marchantia polymorpha TaxID=3197 RepID=A0A176VV06_MARPO|nr:hypothetical protein AXG93_2752s2180 [Marchantia polymorpha subsp. ruderalis]PTQ33228.1 hypothetical protein MARPO_0091s0072 [Marchantia polymorpha]BBN15590.1 hypothetical protein Mp_6g20830 [Marchantia polymorpha subsp. ruderalis]|eukprot:PTQ33228.1 hypothetical protein MARPO_0091s0072 [Marchantia polymorpha]